MAIEAFKRVVETLSGSPLLLSDPRRLQEIKWRMFCASSQPLIPDMTAPHPPPQKKVPEGREETDRHKCRRKNVTKNIFCKN